MAYEQKDNSGSLFKNDKKEKDTHPDYRGDCTVNGEKKSIGAWIKKDKNGKSFMSLSFGEPFQKTDKAEPKKEPKKDAFDDLDDDIPF